MKVFFVITFDCFDSVVNHQIKSLTHLRIFVHSNYTTFYFLIDYDL